MNKTKFLLPLLMMGSAFWLSCQRAELPVQNSYNQEVIKTPEMKTFFEALQQAAKIEIEIRKNGTKDYSKTGFSDESLKILLPESIKYLVSLGYDNAVLAQKAKSEGGNAIAQMAKVEYAKKYAELASQNQTISINY